jgi:predicted alpha/beta-hydrolase family hydrolase
MRHEYMEAFARGLAERSSTVYRFNFLYTELGKKAPDRQPVLEETYAAVVEEIRSDAVGPLILGGKSMGGRIASHIAASGTECDGLVFLGYPLHPPGRPDRIRDAHLGGVTAPMLFVEGTRDPFCPLDTLRDVLDKLGPRHELVVIDDGDHSLKVRKSSGRSTSAAWAEAMDAIADWIARL